MAHSRAARDWPQNGPYSSARDGRDRLNVMLALRVRTIWFPALVDRLGQSRRVRFERRFPRRPRQFQEHTSQRSAKYRYLQARRDRVCYQQFVNHGAQMRRIVKRHDRLPQAGITESLMRSLDAFNCERVARIKKFWFRRGGITLGINRKIESRSADIAWQNNSPFSLCILLTNCKLIVFMANKAQTWVGLCGPRTTRRM
jgi:hypothetical protein